MLILYLRSKNRGITFAHAERVLLDGAGRKVMMSDKAYRGIYYDEPHVQAEFERLVQRIRDAERDRAPLAERQRTAAREAESGAISDKQFQSADAAFIAANNAIAAAQRAVDAFLQANKNYKTS
jgi:hypothetical protein